MISAGELANADCRKRSRVRFFAYICMYIEGEMYHLSLRSDARARSRASDFCAFGPVGDSLLCALTGEGARDRVRVLQAVVKSSELSVHQVSVFYMGGRKDEGKER